MAATISLQLVADIKRATQNIESFAKQGAQSVGQVEKAFGALKIVAGAAVAIVASKQLIDFMGNAIKAATEQEDAQNRLNFALQKTGIYTKETADRFGEFASKVQASSRFGDEMILESAALIQSLGKLDEEGLKRATQGAVDMATVLKVDLKTAAQLMGKAAAGQVGSLSRYGLAVEEGATKAETFANVLKAVEKQFGGAAANDIKTFTGAVALLNNSWSDLNEEIGAVIVNNPVVIQAIKGIAEAFGGVGGQIKGSRGILSDFVSDLVILGSRSLPPTIRVMNTFIVAGQGAVNTLSAMDVALRGVGLAVTFLAREFAISLNYFGVFDYTVDRLTRALTNQKDALFEHALKLRESSKEFTAWNLKINRAIGELDGLADKVEQARDLQIESADKSKSALSAQGDEIVELTDKYNKLRDAAKKAKDEGAFGSKEETPEEAEARAKAESIARDRAQISYEDPFQGIKDYIRLADWGRVGQEIASSFGQGLMQGGEAGARTFIGGAAGAVSEALLPGSGQAVNQLIQWLGQNQEAFREQTDAFIQAIPQIITNITENIPYVMEALAANSDKIIIAMVKSAPKFTRAIALGTIQALQELFSVGGPLDQQMKEANATVTNEYRRIKDQLAGLNGAFNANLGDLQKWVQELPRKLGDAVSTMVPELQNKLSDMFTRIGGEFNQALKDSLSGLMDYVLNDLGPKFDGLRDQIKGAGDSVVEAVKGIFGNFAEMGSSIGKGITIALEDAGAMIAKVFGENIFRGLVYAIEDAASRIAKVFQDAAASVTGGGDGGGIFSGGFDGNPSTPFAFGGVVPSGFPNDTYSARLSSREGVVPSDTMTRLDHFLDNPTSDQAELVALMRQVVMLLSQPQTVSTKITWQNQTLADMNLRLSRMNARTTA